MKGLSPVIATIMLIAITVGVLAVVAIWFPDLISSQTQSTQQQSDQITACSGVRIAAESVTDSSIVYSNPSGKQITNITIFDGTGRNLTQLGNVSLVPGQVANLTWTRGSNTSILMTGLCENALVVRGSCEDGQFCWK